MTGSAKVREAYLKVQAAADRHGVAVMGGPVLDPTVEGCQAALRDGIRCSVLGWTSWDFGGSAKTPWPAPTWPCKAAPTATQQRQPVIFHRTHIPENPTATRLKGELLWLHM